MPNDKKTKKVSLFIKLEEITPTEYDIIETTKAGKERKRIRITWNELESLYENYKTLRREN